MDREALLADISGARPDDGSVVYIARRGADYEWSVMDAHRLGDEAAPDHVTRDDGGSPPDAWIFFSGSWPFEDPDRLPAFMDDLLAEMDSMVGGVDRCRWPLDEPWPHVH